VKPTELLRQLVRFDTTNPPGGEGPCIEFLRELLAGDGIESELLAVDPERPNLVARVRGRGEAPPILLYGHVDVVPTADQAWTVEPFAAEDRDGHLWGRGTIDMKGGVAMLVSAFRRWAAASRPPPGDLVLCIVSDEEAGGVYGARFLTEQHPERFTGVRHALGEFGGFSMELAGRRFYPVMVAEKQCCRVTATVRGPGGHGSIPLRGGAAAKLGAMLTTLDRERLPYHLTDPVLRMIEAIAAALDEPAAKLVRALLDAGTADSTLDALGSGGRIFDALLHNTVNATIVRGGSKVNVIPAAIEVELDGRIVPGMGPDDLERELAKLLGPDVELRIDQFDPGPAGVDLDAFDTLAAVLRDADPEGVPVPLVLTGVTDARFFSTLGIQTYGFLPMRLPPDLDFLSLVHAADERVPQGEVEWGTERIFEAIGRYRG
jgi:acetylornithine deacetylase/succinyl-diaminopimelate desuccinylase-like protein